MAEIVDLCKIAFDMEIDTHSPATSKGQGKHNRAQEYKKLGFRVSERASERASL